MAKKRAKEVTTTTTPEKTGRPVRLDLTAVDYDRLEQLAKERGLSKASYARMAVLERMKADEGRG